MSDATVLKQLKRRVKQVASREQFEYIVMAAKHPREVRKLLTPLLPKGLPCCRAYPRWRRHSPTCPTLKLEVQ